MKIIKLQDEDRTGFHYFCGFCHYWLIKGLGIGVNFCPNCGKKLNWNNIKFKKHHEEWAKLSKEKYNELKSRII